MLKSLFNKVNRPKACNFIKKETLTEVFSCECCEIYKNTYFEKHLQTAASEEENSYQVLLAVFLHNSCIKTFYMLPTL